MNIVRKDAREIADGTSVITQGEIVGFNCSIDADLLLAVALNPLNYRDDTGSFAITKTERGQSYEIYLSSDGELCLLANIKDNFNFHNLQLLNDRELLLVCARSHYRPENRSERNGRIYSTEGQFQKEILLGDGIQDVQADSNGVIWTSYFDEGIFGNYGWTHPIGQNGLIAWNSDGEKLYEELLADKENTLPTHNAKIMIANVSVPEYSKMKTEIKVLSNALTKQDSDLSLVTIMKTIVPEFKSNRSIYEVLD